jgi:hypothetical protein
MGEVGERAKGLGMDGKGTKANVRRGGRQPGRTECIPTADAQKTAREQKYIKLF